MTTYKEIIWDERVEFENVWYVPIEHVDRVLDQIYLDIDNLDIVSLERLIKDLQKKLD